MTAVGVAGGKHRYPAIAKGKDVNRSLDAAVQVIEILTGARGDGMNRALTPADLVKLGVLNLGKGGALVKPPVDDNDEGEKPGQPVQPSGLTATGGFTAVLLRWDAPAYKGHLETEVWRASNNVLGAAVLVGTTKGNLFSDPVPTGSSHFYWVRFVNRAGNTGPHSASVQGKTSDDIGFIIEQITKEGEQSPLVRWLREDVTLVDEQTYLTMIDRILTDLNAPAGPLADVWSSLNALNTVKNQLLNSTDLLKQTQDLHTSQIEQALSQITATRNEVQQFYNAVLAVDPATGNVSLQALEGYRTANDARVTQVEQNLSAVNGRLDQTVSRAQFGQLVGEAFDVTKTYDIGAEVIYNYQLWRCYVPVSSAGAWTGPVNWALVGSLTGKMSTLQQSLDAVNGQLLTKVSQAAFDAQTLRLSQVENFQATFVDNNVSVGQVVQNIRSELWRAAELATQAELDKWNAVVEQGRYRVGQATFNQSITTRVELESSRLEEARYQLVQHGNAIATNQYNLTLLTDDHSATVNRLQVLRTEYDQTAVEARELFTMSASSTSAFLAAYRQLSGEVRDPGSGLAKTRAILDEVTSFTLSPGTALMQQINRANATANNAQAMANDILTLSGVANGSAMARLFNQLGAEIDGANANIVQLSLSLVGPTGTISQTIRDHTVSFGGTTVTLQQLATAAASTDGSFRSMWGVKSTVGQLTAGFGLLNTGSLTQFAINAQQLLVLGQNGAVNPFMVVGGRVLIDTALIKAATVQELVAGSVVADTVKAAASITSPVIVGGSITGSDLRLLSGGYEMNLMPYQNFMLWCGPAGAAKNAQNAALALTNDGRVFARGMTIYDNSGNTVLDSSGLSGTYIKDLSVDAFKIKGQSINLKTIAQANWVNIPPNGSPVSKASASVFMDSVVPGTVLDITFEVRFYCEYHDKRMLEFRAAIYDENLGYYLNTFRIKPPFWSQDGESHIMNTVQLTGRAVVEYTYAATNVSRSFSVHVWAVGSYYSSAPLGLNTMEHEGWLVIDVGKR